MDPTMQISPGYQFCPNCGAQNRVGAKFCASCGNLLGDMPAPAPNYPPPPTPPQPQVPPVPPAPYPGHTPPATPLPSPGKANPYVKPTRLASLPISRLLVGLIIITICLILSSAGAFVYINQRQVLSYLPSLPFGFGQLQPSNWVQAITLDDNDEHVLYALNPLTAEKHRLTASEQNGDFVIISTALTGRTLPIGLPNFFTGYHLTSGFNGLAAYPLPDNQRILYSFLQDERWNLVVSDINGQNKTTLIEDANQITTVADPEDSMVAITVQDEDDLTSGYVFSLENGQQISTIFEEAEENSFLVTVPYNSKIFYAIQMGNEVVSYVANPDGSEAVELNRFNEGEDEFDGFGGFAFLPDASGVIYATRKGVYWQSFTNGEKRELRRGDAGIVALSPAGDYVLVAQNNDDDSNDLFLINVADGSATDLARAQELVWGIFTADSQKLLYLVKKGGRMDLTLHTMADGENERLVRDEYVQIGIPIPNDGRYFAYVQARDEDSAHEVKVVDTRDGSRIDIAKGREDVIIPYDLAGGQLLFAAIDRDNDRATLYVTDFLDDTENEAVLLDDQAELYLDARLLAGGAKVIFSALFDANSGAVYTINTDGSERKLMIDDAAAGNRFYE